MMRPLCLLAVAMLAVPASAFIPQTTLRTSSPVVSSSSSRTASRRTALTMMAARRPFIAGNWKENPDTLEAALDLAKAVRSFVNEMTERGGLGCARARSVHVWECVAVVLFMPSLLHSSLRAGGPCLSLPLIH